MNIATALNSDFLTASDKDLSETGTKILNFGRLKEGWHFGEGSPPNSQLIKNAIELDGLAQELGFTSTNAFPGPNGEIRYCVYDGDYYYEFTLEIDGSVTAVLEAAAVETEAVVSFEAVRDILKRFSIWNTSDSFIGDIGTSRERAFRAWLSRTRPELKQYQWFIESAQSKTEWTYVLGSIDSIENTHHVSPFGFSTRNFSLWEQSSQTNPAILETSAIETCVA